MNSIKLFINIFCLIVTNSLFSQNAKTFENYTFKNNEFYLCYRGTEAKRNLIAGDFNLSGSPATHIGIGLKVDGKDVIYNVSNERLVNNSALIVDSLKSFFHLNADVYYAGIYSRKITINQKVKLIVCLKNNNKRKIVFDRNFILSKDDTLYCSEFVVRTLSNLFQTYYKPSKLFLKTFLYKRYFKANYLFYYPVDYFIKNKAFKKEIEIVFKNKVF